MHEGPAIIFDVDGTLADVRAVRHYVTADPRSRDFRSFHAAASFVPPNVDVARLALRFREQGYAILVLTSRTENWRYLLKLWLRKWDIPFDLIGMRGERDFRRDDAVKRDLFAMVRGAGYEPVLAIDDNPLVIALWRSLGIPTVWVPGLVANIAELEVPAAMREETHG